MSPETSGKSMRGKNKREALLRTAWEVFSEQGYQSASMDMVVARAGGSKQTLYNYFKSKEDLLRAVLEGRKEDLGRRVYGAFEVPSDFAGSLWRFGTMFLDTAINSDLIEIYRLAIAESKTLSLGHWMYELGFVGQWKVMAEYLEKHIDPSLFLHNERWCREQGGQWTGGWTAAMHLRGLLEGELVLRRLCGVIQGLTKDEINEVVRVGLEAFLRIYAPDQVDALREHAMREGCPAR